MFACLPSLALKGQKVPTQLLPLPIVLEDFLYKAQPAEMAKPSEAKKNMHKKEAKLCNAKRHKKHQRIKEQTLRDAQTAEEICFLPVSSGHMARCLTILPTAQHNKRLQHPLLHLASSA